MQEAGGMEMIHFHPPCFQLILLLTGNEKLKLLVFLKTTALSKTPKPCHPVLLFIFEEKLFELFIDIPHDLCVFLLHLQQPL
jgi:hypothetical protein